MSEKSVGNKQQKMMEGIVGDQRMEVRRKMEDVKLRVGDMDLIPSDSDDGRFKFIKELDQTNMGKRDRRRDFRGNTGLKG